MKKAIEIRTYVFVDSADDRKVGELRDKIDDAIEHAICPDMDSPDHQCEHGWSGSSCVMDEDQLMKRWALEDEVEEEILKRKKKEPVTRRK